MEGAAGIFASVGIKIVFEKGITFFFHTFTRSYFDTAWASAPARCSFLCFTKRGV